VHSKYIGEFFVRSDSPKGKSKRQVKKPPFAETSQLYWEVFREQVPCRSGRRSGKRIRKANQEEVRKIKENYVVKYKAKTKAFKEANGVFQSSSLCYISRRNTKQKRVAL
jgi:hypothetical protein